jgi:hypothetical protein
MAFTFQRADGGGSFVIYDIALRENIRDRPRVFRFIKKLLFLIFRCDFIMPFRATLQRILARAGDARIHFGGREAWASIAKQSQKHFGGNPRIS